MSSNVKGYIRATLLLSASALACVMTTTARAADEIELIEAVDAVDPAIESIEPVELIEAVDLIEPLIITDPVNEIPGEVELELVTELQPDVPEVEVTDIPTEIPAEWQRNDFEPGVMYSTMSFDSNADDIATRAAEQAAGRTLDQIDAAEPAAAPLR